MMTRVNKKIKSSIKSSKLYKDLFCYDGISFLENEDDLGRGFGAYNDDHLSPSLDVSSRRRTLPFKSEKQGKQNSLRIPSMGEPLVSRLPSTRNGFYTNNHQSYDSIDPDVKGRKRSQLAVEKPKYEMPLQRDLDAAHALLELANEVRVLPKCSLQSYSLNGVLAKIDNDRVSHERKAKKHCRNPVDEDEMKGKSGDGWNSTRLGKRGILHNKACLDDGDCHRLDMLWGACNQVSKKQKGNADMAYIEGPNEFVFDQPLSIRKPMNDVVPMRETKRTDSFSIIHLFNAIRKALVAPHVFGFNAKAERKNLPFLNVHEVVQAVVSNPGDPNILETKEPLEGLVRGVLKMFSSKTAPMGVRGWKALTCYEKTSRSWSWIGPVSLNSAENNSAEEEEQSYETWGLPRRVLVKLVDSFSSWLKYHQEQLQKIKDLPAPPASLLKPITNKKQRFKNLNRQKSNATIGPSSEEVRNYFHREEEIRYAFPDKSFSYTTIDGRKSRVAPIQSCNGRPKSKCRDHYMLKSDRPPPGTILSLVRDAVARLPGGIGTRGDVSTLIRDSQYIIQDFSDIEVNQVVSGALDRLHYERDPCVRYDGDRKLWVYLHGEREEDDFEDDGTANIMKMKLKLKQTLA